MTENGTEELRERILQSLRMVIDPELGENLVDLGLIYAIEIEEGKVVHIEMSTTTRGCPAAGYLRDAVHSAAWIVPGIEDVDVELTYDPPWTPDLISYAIRHKFAGSVWEARR